jgi:hypothetical protein
MGAVGYRNRREKVIGFARSPISTVVDGRDPFQIARGYLVRRVEAMMVA